MNEAERSGQRFTCPACGFLAFDEPPGSYEICDVCGWEDDPVQLASPTFGGGANKASLVEAQLVVLRDHPLAIRELAGVRRDDLWRPLSVAEAESDRVEGMARAGRSLASAR